MSKKAPADTGTSMQFDREKLKSVILYTCTKCETTKLGAVKLHKVLYYADMLHYADVGAPITGATYRKRPFGPTCDSLLSVLKELERELALEVREVIYFGYTKKEFIPLKQPNMNRLNKSELSLLDEVIEFVCFNNTAKTISEYSHNRAWELAEYGDVLKYNSVFHLFPTQVSQEALDWAAGEVANCVPQGSDKNSVGDVSFRDFRKRVLEARG